jgi:hypothetical protein
MRKTNYVSKVYHDAAVLCLKYMVQVMLYPMTNVWYFSSSTSRSTRAANGYKIKHPSQKQTTKASEILKIIVQSQVLQETDMHDVL